METVLKIILKNNKPKSYGLYVREHVYFVNITPE